MHFVLPIMGFLIFFPLLVMLGMLAIKNRSIRGWAVNLSAFLIAAASVALLVLRFNAREPLRYAVHSGLTGHLMTVASLLITLYIIFASVRDKKYGTLSLAVIQLGCFLTAEIMMDGRGEAECTLLLDNLSMIMVLLVGVVGSLICIFAVGYMEKYHRHKQMADRSREFFAAIFAFISAMFGLAFSNDLTWLLFFWEVTTFCSFKLISYARREDAIRNSYRALMMNIAGGIAFQLGILFLYKAQGVFELDKLILLAPEAVMLPAVLLAFAGLVKSAQFPFSSWLLGAMVAPTPTSALLHSSTMVKAGVYLIIRLSPLFKDTPAGLTIALIGGVTFLLSSLIAISKHNVKKLLAYSTVSTLGLIVLCAGVGTYQTIWTAVLLMIFHAVAKSLLFLSVGTVEQGIESLNIEDMDALIMRMPKVTLCLLIGIAGMFIAPFGMLISKWAALEALIKANPMLSFFVVFGSSATLFFYTKWMGKLIMIKEPAQMQEGHVSGDEWFTMSSLSGLTLFICIAFPLISSYLIDPYIQYVYHQGANMSQSNEIIMLIMLALILLLPLQIFLQSKQKKRVIAYLCGANITENKQDYEANLQYHTAAQTTKEVELRNYYFEGLFGEEKLGKLGLILSVVLLAVLFGVVFI